MFCCLFQVVMLHVGNLLEEMVNEEASLKKRLLANVDRYGKELMALCQELSLPIYEVCTMYSVVVLGTHLINLAMRSMVMSIFYTTMGSCADLSVPLAHSQFNPIWSEIFETLEATRELLRYWKLYYYYSNEHNTNIICKRHAISKEEWLHQK